MMKYSMGKFVTVTVYDLSGNFAHAITDIF